MGDNTDNKNTTSPITLWIEVEPLPSNLETVKTISTRSSVLQVGSQRISVIRPSTCQPSLEMSQSTQTNGNEYAELSEAKFIKSEIQCWSKVIKLNT